jgi:hypothetical protein
MLQIGPNFAGRSRALRAKLRVRRFERQHLRLAGIALGVKVPHDVGKLLIGQLQLVVGAGALRPGAVGCGRGDRLIGLQDVAMACKDRLLRGDRIGDFGIVAAIGQIGGKGDRIGAVALGD